MHSYIDYSILRNFDDVDDITIEDVIRDLRNNNIHGYAPDEEESEYYIADALYSDMIQIRSNYKAYIEDGMTARMLMTLRFNSLLTFEDELSGFFYEHRTIDTPEQAIEHRIKWCRKHVNSEYQNTDWQNFLLLRILWRVQSKDINIDYEPCFEDKKYNRVKTIEDIINDWYEDNKPPIVDGWIAWDKAPLISDDLYNYLHRTVDAEQ